MNPRLVTPVLLTGAIGVGLERATVGPPAWRPWFAGLALVGVLGLGVTLALSIRADRRVLGR